MKPRPFTPGTQNRRIVDYLKLGFPLTPMGALKYFQCWRLGGRIFEIKRRGYRVKRCMVELPNGKVVASYFLPRAGSRR